MSLNLYPLIRPFLFALDAENAHDLMLDWLKRSQSSRWLQKLYAQPRIDDPIELAGLRFANRVGLAAGLDKNARCIDGLAAMGFGFVEVGTVTPLAQPGNPKPRMFRIREANAVINRMGFNNQGLETFVRNVRRSRVRNDPQHPLQLGLNIGKNAATPMERAAEDYLAGLRGVYPFADYVTVNISSPNTKNLRDLQSDTALDALLGALVQEREELKREHPHKPLFLKIAPDLDATEIGLIAATLQRHGVDGVIATNTTVDHSAVEAFAHGKEQGGVSGSPVRKSSKHVIRRLRKELGPGFPIIGVGGILDAEDAVEKLEAGADLVQLYSGLIFQGPALVPQVAAALKDHAAQVRLAETEV
ncbi:quinone-dependent dihydroorotate dehydrogenase [Corticibacter populi]|uniref:Dihydroorotate dehydrogenase (quinone) n=1 Tax=Corticibacter populi TaxID=1550736 RepID=A0A3M6QLY5_9BURK|nr:quinone-dependent dihydroorotate dehydrogenase [Corticibacter populi]RMX04090.1 quinone-dependent dihydroorotate dehydrogenase [Corticibacter populi]RZS33097.1 dihydroorotate oxidase A [Corticibacter populi]